jgi:hypothetical protein
VKLRDSIVKIATSFVGVPVNCLMMPLRVLTAARVLMPLEGDTLPEWVPHPVEFENPSYDIFGQTVDRYIDEFLEEGVKVEELTPYSAFEVNMAPGDLCLIHTLPDNAYPDHAAFATARGSSPQLLHGLRHSNKGRVCRTMFPKDWRIQKVYRFNG